MIPLLRTGNIFSLDKPILIPLIETKHGPFEYFIELEIGGVPPSNTWMNDKMNMGWTHVPTRTILAFAPNTSDKTIAYIIPETNIEPQISSVKQIQRGPLRQEPVFETPYMFAKCIKVMESEIYIGCLKSQLQTALPSSEMLLTPSRI